MGSVNKVILIGNLGVDPELRYTANDRPVANFRIATSERFYDRERNLQERTEWHRIVVWGKQAEACDRYLRKGRKVYVEGRIQTREYDDRDGNKRYITEVVADQVTFLGGNRQEDGDQQERWGGGRGGGRSQSSRGTGRDDGFYDDQRGSSNRGGFQGGGGDVDMGQFPGDADEDDVPF